jgi:hypothetical protein
MLSAILSFASQAATSCCAHEYPPAGPQELQAALQARGAGSPSEQLAQRYSQVKQAPKARASIRERILKATSPATAAAAAAASKAATPAAAQPALQPAAAAGERQRSSSLSARGGRRAPS